MPETEFLTDQLWVRMRAEAAASRSRHCAVAYVTDPASLQLVAGDTLVVDASDVAIACGKTSASALSAIAEASVEIFSLANLHAKIYVFESCVVVGSANLSRNSQVTLEEAAIVSYDKTTVHRARQHVSILAAAGTRVDEGFLERVRRIPISQQNSTSPTSLSTSVDTQPSGDRLWRLAEPPAGGALLRAYFVALIQAQLGNVRPDEPFQLWNGNFRTHLESRRLRQEGRSFLLSSTGVAYFTTGKTAPRPDLLTGFLRALRTGHETDLPDGLNTTTLVPFR